MLEERVGTSTTANKQFVYHPHYVDAIALRRDASGTDHYYLQDANFNVTAVTDNTGAVKERYAYTPYGEVTVLDADFSADSDNKSDISNEHLYTGRRLDPETGLQLNRNRFYAAGLGRWVNRDPIGYFRKTKAERESSKIGPEEFRVIFHAALDVISLMEIRTILSLSMETYDEMIESKLLQDGHIEIVNRVRISNGLAPIFTKVESMSTYQYVTSGPVANTDPEGLLVHKNPGLFRACVKACCGKGLPSRRKFLICGALCGAAF